MRPQKQCSLLCCVGSGPAENRRRRRVRERILGIARPADIKEKTGAVWWLALRCRRHYIICTTLTAGNNNTELPTTSYNLRYFVSTSLLGRQKNEKKKKSK